MIGRLLQCRERPWARAGLEPCSWPLHLPHVTFPWRPPNTPPSLLAAPYLSEPTIAFPHCHLRACNKGLAWILSAQGGHSESANSTHGGSGGSDPPVNTHPTPQSVSRHRSEDTLPPQELDLLEGKKRPKRSSGSNFDLPKQFLSLGLGKDRLLGDSEASLGSVPWPPQSLGSKLGASTVVTSLEEDCGLLLSRNKQAQ